MHYVGFCLSSFFFILINIEWVFFDPLCGLYNERILFFWNSDLFSFGADGLSLPFMYLTCFLIPLCILYNWNTISTIRSEYVLVLLLLEVPIITLFMTSNFLLFFFLFECLLFPFFVLFGLRSLRRRKIHAALMLLLYTLIGSLALLVGVVSVYSHFGTFDLFLLTCMSPASEPTFTICGLLLFSFLTKIPVVPFHSWLPEAHVEAPTELSVILAGVILKIGTYGLFRILLPIFRTSFYYFSPAILVLAAVSVVCASLSAVSQLDIKKVIAYSSIAHMNIALIGLCCASVVPMCGSVFVMFSHGIVSGGLFFLVGMLYERYGTKIVKYYTGLASYMPLFSAAFFLLLLGNLGFPLTSGFVGESFIVIGVTASGGSLFAFILALGIFFSTIYSLWLYNKIFFGISSVSFSGDITYREFLVILPIIIHLFVLGVFPHIILCPIYTAVLSYYCW